MTKLNSKEQQLLENLLEDGKVYVRFSSKQFPSYERMEKKGAIVRSQIGHSFGAEFTAQKVAA